MLQDELYLIDHLFMGGIAAPPHVDAESLAMMKNDIAASLHVLLKAHRGELVYFPDFEAWERFYDGQDWCLTIGTRLHSAIFSCNRGVPAIVTSGDARARETCEYFGMPHRPDLDGSTDLAPEYERLDLSAMNRKYAGCYADFVAYLAAHGLEPAAIPYTGESFHFPDIAKPPEQRTLPASMPGFPN